MRYGRTTTAMALALTALAAPAWADMEAAKAFLDKEIGDLSTLTVQQGGNGYTGTLTMGVDA